MNIAEILGSSIGGGYGLFSGSSPTAFGSIGRTIGSSFSNMGAAGGSAAIAATIFTPALTGTSLDQYAQDPSYMFDSSQDRMQADALGALASQGPGAAFKKTVEMGLMMRTLPNIAKRLTGEQGGGKLTPFGLKTAIFGTGGTRSGIRGMISGTGRGLWGFAAGSILTGSPLGGLLTTGLFSKFASGGLFASKRGSVRPSGGVYGSARKGGMIGAVARMTGMNPRDIRRYADTALGSFGQPSIMQTTNYSSTTVSRSAKIGNHQVGKYLWNIDPDRGVRNKEFRSEVNQNRKRRKNRKREIRGRRARYDVSKYTEPSMQILGERTNIDYSKSIAGPDTPKGRILANTMLEEHGEVNTSSSATSRTINYSESFLAGRKDQISTNLADILDKEGSISSRQFDSMAISRGSMVETINGQKVNTSAYKNYAATAFISQGIERNLFNRLTGKGGKLGFGLSATNFIGGAFGLPFGKLGKFAYELMREGGYDSIKNQVDIINSKMATAANAVSDTEIKSSISNGRRKAEIQTRTRAAKESQSKLMDFIVGKEASADKAIGVNVSQQISREAKSTSRITLDKTNIRKISTGGTIARAGLSLGANAMRALYVWGGVKKVGAYAVNSALNTLKSLSTVSKQVGRMEFGTGRTLETQVGATERGKAIQAMQNIGITARSYLGQEAQLMSQ